MVPVFSGDKLFEERIKSAYHVGNAVTIVTLFGIAKGYVIKCYDGWFTFQVKTNNSKVNIYYEDVMLLEEHELN